MYAIIDNSTLTAVQRLMGEIEIKNKHTIDGDILAFESFLQTILFYDDVFFIDDYKSEYKETREDYFKYIWPIKLDDITYNSMMLKTRELTSDFIPEIRNRKFNNTDIKSFFDQLRMNITFTWDLNSSVYYLNYKLLQEHSGVDIAKYSALSTMIYSQCYDNEPIDTMNRKIPLIYDSNGIPINKEYTIIDKEGRIQETGISKQVSAFMAGLSWLDFRTTFYTLVAKHLNMDLILHPIRQAYEINILHKYSNGDAYSRAILSRINHVAEHALNAIVSSTQPILVSHELPMFSAWVASKSNDPKSFIDMIYTLKGEKEFIVARDILNKLDDVHSEKGNQKYIKDANLLLSDFEKQMNKLMDQYGVNPSNINLTSSIIKAYNVSSLVTDLPTIPSVNFTVKRPELLKKTYRFSGFGATYKNIINDLTAISQLGKYHDIISSNVRLSKEAAYFDIKEETKKYENCKSYWKIPL